MSQSAKFGELVIRDVSSSLDEASVDEIQSGFSTIDLNGMQANETNSNDNESDLGYTSFGIGHKIATVNDTSPELSTPGTPQKNTHSYSQQHQQQTNGMSGININLSSILPQNLSTPTASSMLTSASEASTKFAMKTATTFETIRQWSKSAYKCTRQIVSEKLGKSNRTVDPELESQIEVCPILIFVKFSFLFCSI